MFDNYKEQILNITKKIGNVCDIGSSKLCKSPMHSYESGVGCCRGCQYHTKDGCSTESLICMAWYCNYIQKYIPKDIVYELWDIIDELLAKGLEIRQSKEEQIKLLSKFK